MNNRTESSVLLTNTARPIRRSGAFECSNCPDDWSLTDHLDAKRIQMGHADPLGGSVLRVVDNHAPLAVNGDSGSPFYLQFRVFDGFEPEKQV